MGPRYAWPHSLCAWYSTMSKRCKTRMVRRLLGAFLVGALAWPAVADGSPRDTGEVAAPQRLETAPHASSTARSRFLLRLREDAVPTETDSRASSSTVERRGNARRLLRGAGAAETHADGSPQSLRRNGSSEGIRIVDAPYAPETLEGMLRTEESHARSGVEAQDRQDRVDRGVERYDTGLRSQGIGLERDGYARGLRAAEGTGSVGRSLDRRHAATEDDVRGLRHMSSIGRARAEDARSGLGGVTGVEASRERAETRRVERAAGVFGHEDTRRAQGLSRIGAAYRAEQMGTVMGAEVGAAEGGVSSLRASARINESIGTANTFVVLSVENSGTETVSAPVLRLMLPEHVEYKGIAFAPPGTGAAVVETEQGRAVDVVLPLRVPSGHSSRAMVYLSPGTTLRAEDLDVTVLPQGVEKAKGVAGNISAGSPVGMGTSGGVGVSKDP